MMVELDARYRFENYIVGSANRLAVSAARAVAQAPGSTYNPLFIYSSSGLGKTHLLLAIGHLARQLQPDLGVEYATVDEFVDELTSAISAGAMEAFKRRYQSVGMLLLDDVQFLAGRRETQSEMLRLFNVLQRSGRQVVLTSDRPPAEIADLDERLITRFSGGLVVDVGAPDYETRVAILRVKCEERGVQFEAGVLEALARIEFSNVRELQGALHRLIACQALGERTVTAANVRELLGERVEAAVGVAGGAERGAGGGARAARGEEFASFLSDVSEAVAQHLEAWRLRLADAVTLWRGRGYATAMLERVLEAGGRGDGAPMSEAEAEALIAEYEAAVARLEALAQEAGAHDPQLAASALFHDPERVAEAELVVARLMGDVEPPPGPQAVYTRAEFEVSPSNQLAAHAADAVIEEPGTKYNPLVVHGPAGVGKTHLLHALGNELVAMSGGAMVVACVSGPQFVDELIAALQDDKIERWRARYRMVDVLILDDVQACAGKERTQEELFHLFNSLYASGRQIILGADRAPKAIEGLEERLRSRFEGGLVVEIQPPDRVLREKLYARHLAAADQRPDRALVDYLAARALGDKGVGEIAATVQRLVQAAAVVQMPLTAEFARKELEGGSGPGAAARPLDGRTVDDFFLDDEKVVWAWPDVGGRAIEEFR